MGFAQKLVSWPTAVKRCLSVAFCGGDKERTHSPPFRTVSLAQWISPTSPPAAGYEPC